MTTPTPPSSRKKETYPRLIVPESLRRKMVEVARQFRKEPTPSEHILWQTLRGKKLAGIKFRRQQPIGPFIVDFYASEYRLIVEVDGPIHETQQEADQARQKILLINQTKDAPSVIPTGAQRREESLR